MIIIEFKNIIIHKFHQDSLKLCLELLQNHYKWFASYLLMIFICISLLIKSDNVYIICMTGCVPNALHDSSRQIAKYKHIDAPQRIFVYQMPWFTIKNIFVVTSEFATCERPNSSMTSSTFSSLSWRSISGGSLREADKRTFSFTVNVPVRMSS